MNREINAAEAKRAEAFAREFNEAALAARGESSAYQSEKQADIDRMMDRFFDDYAEAFALGRDAGDLARRTTVRWWAHVFGEEEPTPEMVAEAVAILPKSRGR